MDGWYGTIGPLPSVERCFTVNSLWVTEKYARMKVTGPGKVPTGISLVLLNLEN